MASVARPKASRFVPTLAARHGVLLGTALAFGILLVFAPSTASAQRYKKGDSIEVLHLGKWIPATVVDTNRRGDVMAEYEFAGRARQQAFKKNDVRHEFESGAFTRARSWSDSSGSFTIRAALIGLEEETVTLRKEDLAEIKVPIAKLSATDQAYLKRLRKEAGPGVMKGPDPPPLEDFQDSGVFASIGTFNPNRAALEPDPLPAYMKMKQGGVAFPLEKFFDRIGGLLPLGGTDVWLLAALHNGTPSGNLPTRLLWASLERQKIEGRQLLPPSEVVMDYHQPSHRLLTHSLIKDGSWGTSALTIWEVLPTDKEVKPIIRWNTQPDEGRSWDPWARLVDANIVVQRWKKQEFVAWDIEAKKMLYRTTQESFFAPAPTLSGGRRYLFMPEDKAVRVLESTTGNVLSTLPVDDGCSAIAVTEDGRRAALLGRSTLTVYDLTSDSAPPDKYQAEAIGTPFTARMRWVGDDRVMVDRGRLKQVLFNAKHRIALWNYNFHSDAVRESKGSRLQDIVTQHLVYAATVRSGAARGIAVGAVELPGPAVNEAAETLNRDELLVVKEGTGVRIDVRAGANNARVQAALEKELAANGWKLDSQANVVMIAEMKIGETQTTTYRTFGVGFSPGRGQEETVSVTPYISTLRVEVDGKVAWQSGTSTGAPPVVRVEEGTSIQNEVNKWQRPNVEFFEHQDVPAEILDPTKKDGIGSTQVTNRGLIPKTE